MLKWTLLVTAVVIIIAVLAYKILFYAPVYSIFQEEKFQRVTGTAVTYIVTSSAAGKIAMPEIEYVTAEKNFPFTRFNLKHREPGIVLPISGI